MEERAAARLAAPDGLTHRRSTFTRRDVVQAAVRGGARGADVTVAEIERAADRFLRSDRAVVLAVGDRRAPDVLRRQDGRVVPSPAEERRVLDA